MTQPSAEPDDITIGEVIAKLRHEEEVRCDAALKIIQTVHSTESTLQIAPEVLANRRTLRQAVPNTIVKTSNSREGLGFWREGQTRGRPSRRMPVEQVLLDANERYFKALRDLVPRSLTNATLSQRSVAARLVGVLAPDLCARYDALTEMGVPRVERVNRIAKAFKRSADHVRRVLRAHGYRLGPTRQK